MRSYGVFAGDQFGQGTGRIWLDNVYCRGYENALRSCRHAGWGTHNCRHSEDTSIACPDSYNIIGMPMILFLIKSYDVASECITFFDCSVSDAIYKRKLKFSTKLRHSVNTTCKLFEKYIVEELNTVHRHFV